MPVIDLGKLRATNRRAADAIKAGAASGVLAIVKSAAEIAANTKTIQNRTGAMRSGWAYRLIRSSNIVRGKLLNRVQHALYQEKGTGVFGPNRAPYWIEARKARVLRFQVASGEVVFRRRVLHYGVHPRYIGQAAMFGRAAMFFGYDPDRNTRVLRRWISGELAKVR